MVNFISNQVYDEGSVIQLKQLAEEIIAGRRLTREDDLTMFLTADLEELCQGADMIRKALCGNKADLCGIVNGRCGHCSEDCRFCAQSGHNHADVHCHPFLPYEELLEAFRYNRSKGIKRFSIVTSGRGIQGEDLEKALEAYRGLLKEGGMKVCASHGLQTVEEFRRIRETGVDLVHANLETSRRYFPYVCSTHTYQDELDNVRNAREAGLEVCSGGIIGMGETWEDRMELALSLSELDVYSIPINILQAVKGTPFENIPPISTEDILRTVAIFRYLNPTALIRMAAGRGRFADGGRKLFRSGANAAVTGDMLTTTGTSIAGDVAMFQELGYELI